MIDITEWIMEVDSNMLSQLMHRYSQTGQTFDKDMLKEILDSSSLIDNLELMLRGLKRKPTIVDVKQGEQTTQVLSYKYEIETEDILMNDKGIDFVISQLRGLADNKDIKLSNLNENEAYKLMRSTALNILKELWINYENKKFRIENLTSLIQVYNLILATLVALFKRSYEQGERKFIKETTSETRMVSNQQRPGFGLSLGGRGK